MKKHLYILTVITSSLLIPSLSFASPTTTGFYLGAGLGTNYGIIDLFGTHTEVGGFAGNVNLGYQFNRFFAIDSGFSAYIKTGGEEGENVYGGHIAGKVMLPFNNRFNIYGKLGASFLTTIKDTNALVGLYYAAGASYAVTKKVDLDVEASGTTSGFLTFGQIT